MEEIISLYHVEREDVYHIRVLGKYACDYRAPLCSLTKQQTEYVIDALFPDATIIPYSDFLKRSRQKGNAS